MGEVFENDPATVLKWQGPLDSILNVHAFTVPVPRTYLRGSGLDNLTVAEANVVELQGSNATHLSASWLIVVVAGIVIGSDTKFMIQCIPLVLSFASLMMDSPLLICRIRE